MTHMHLMPNNAERECALIGIDPGTEMLGVGTIYFDAKTLEIIRTTAATFVGSKLGMNRWLADIHSPRFSRLEAHRENLLALMYRVNPVSVTCESSFFNPRRPNAFEALVETISMLRHVIWEYDRNIPLNMIDPPSVKRAVGAKGGADKDGVKEKILGIAELNYFGNVPLHMLDEHSIDGIAVGYSKLLEYRKTS